MPLAEYKKKRDFSRTTEPAARKRRKTAQIARPQFVVQKHAARRLHYDFRLELDGVLKSWAVPKGPSLDPGVKSLAVEVEDHPLEYGAFEGVIPSGQYGGGTVMVWDRGHWAPEENPSKSLRQGKLNFELQGERLKGRWSLVRMTGKPSDNGKNWLLIKRDDKQAKHGDADGLLKRKIKSVVSDRTMDEIAADMDRVWDNREGSSLSEKNGTKNASGAKRRSATAAKRFSIKTSELSKAKKRKQPESIRPQLATLVRQVPRGERWLHELKFDGYRILAAIADGNVRLLTRNGKDWSERFPTIVAAVGELPIKNAILDGEVVALDAEGKSNFQKLQNWLSRGKDDVAVYYVFDLPYLEGYELTQTPLIERKRFLSRIIHSVDPKNTGTVRYSDHIRGQGEDVFQHACRAALEGVVSKLAESVYQGKRSPAWRKTKCIERQEFVIGGYTAPSGSRTGFGALLLGYYDKQGSLIYSGRVGTGFTNDSLRTIKAKLTRLKRTTPAYVDPPTGSESRGVSWVEPEVVAEVEFTEWTADGALRHPSFVGLREDKNAESVTRERPKEVISISRNPAANGKHASNQRSSAKVKASSANTSIAGVTLTHPDRVAFPGQGLTKLDLAVFTEKMADRSLPYIAGRPLTLVRCPRGQGKDCFFQKHLTGSVPDVVSHVDIKEKSSTKKYPVVKDLPGLISLVQIGVLEIHPWLARADRVERPDQVVFDLDPGENTAWKSVMEAAILLRDELTKLSLQTFVRVTGGKGLHIVIPIVRGNSWDDTKKFAKHLAKKVAGLYPALLTIHPSKAKRKGKVFIDYLRNSRGATAVASYSTRARPGAPVATPIRWEEVSTKLRPDQYTVKNIFRRLSSLKDDPWRDFLSARQSLPSIDEVAND